MTIDEASKSVGRLVRISPKALRTTSGNRHHSRGRLISVGRKTIRVHVLGFGEEDIDPQHARIWHAREPDAPVVLEHTAAQQLEKQMTGTFRKPSNVTPATPPAVVTFAEPDSLGEMGQVFDQMFAPAKPLLSDVIAELTSLVTGVKAGEQELATAESLLKDAEAAKAKAEAQVLDAMGKLETLKSRVRAARKNLDTVMEGV